VPVNLVGRSPAIQIAMMGGLSYKALRDGVFAHPSYAASLNNLFMTIGLD
jgi:hypothetical protein